MELPQQLAQNALANNNSNGRRQIRRRSLHCPGRSGQCGTQVNSVVYPHLPIPFQ